MTLISCNITQLLVPAVEKYDGGMPEKLRIADAGPLTSFDNAAVRLPEAQKGADVTGLRDECVWSADADGMRMLDRLDLPFPGLGVMIDPVELLAI